MAEFHDLSPYSYTDFGIAMLNVGWLGAGFEPSRVRPAQNPSVLSRLVELIQRPRALMLGYHVCEYCDVPIDDAWPGGTHHGIKSGAFGTGEIHVYGRNGRNYCAPTMIHHYMQDHGYQPPVEFTEALLDREFRNWNNEGKKLGEMLADPSENPGSRVSAAIDLGFWCSEEAQIYLGYSIAEGEHAMLDIVGPDIGISLAEIWAALGKVNAKIYGDLPIQIRHVVDINIEHIRAAPRMTVSGD